MITKRDSYIAAIYCRLSQDDGQVGTSGSIETQKTLLTQYCKDNGFAVGKVYCDDGWSGTNFERPQFKQMMEDIEDGKINLVVVKDLSRFGREYAQMGLYIEHYFEEKEVRFIAVGEGIDTINGTDNIIMPITNVMNSVYAKECSRKTKAAHQARAKAGMYIGSHAPFGYVKDPGDRHHLVIDPPAAEVVRLIFKLFSEGVGYVRMTKMLREQNILNPQAYFNQNNPDYYKSDYWRKPFDWHATSIRVILSNRVYLGELVFGKSKSKGFYTKKRVSVPEEEWIVVEKTHEPIIDRELWDTVQKLMASKRRETKQGEIQMFAGLVKCAGCGSSLNVGYDNRKGKFTGFSCWVYKNYGKERCTSHAIGWQTMCQLVLEDIRRNARVAAYHSEEYLAALAEAKAAKQKRETDQHKRELKKADKRAAEQDKILNKLYEDRALGRISEERYQSMAAQYEQEQRDLMARKAELGNAIQHAEEVYANVENYVKLIRRYTDLQELNTKVLNELIDRIVVHEKVVNPDGQKSQRVDIHYKFIGFVPVPLEAFLAAPIPKIRITTEPDEQDVPA